MLEKNAKIYVAGHHGLVGSAIWNNLLQRGYTNLVGRSHKELDLLDGVAVKSFFDEENKPQRKFCTWEEIRPFIFSVIKGSKLPKHMKIVLSAPDELRNNLCENASALFINVNYENNVLTLITGYSLKTFSLNKDHEIIWDNYVEEFIKENNISVSTQL